ncbi:MULTISPECIES: hypothetical protein [Bifidobacterium]|uniref:Colicin transporter n=2 Tax=Bifidobacterium TaxID=1678 RepID=A0A261FTG5_9BIFI|nr:MULTISPECIES: hypothetical protein [Bifidobacterium]OZG62491.1 colicin transporter [Bifidobacterium lemurum]OZG69027.1 colicin transporter [Bifidobacterium eulemuris]QOL31445.1 colicin transporter [Bifidobacterium eulemuris]QOL33832.1 colicin transporter [Bifidobacterium lemurum]
MSENTNKSTNDRPESTVEDMTAGLIAHDQVDEVTAEAEALANADADKSEHSKRKRKRMIAFAVIVAVIVLAVGGAIGWLAWSNARLDAAKTACATASETVSEAKQSYAALLEGDAADAAAITTDMVADPDTLDALTEAMDEQAPDHAECEAEDTAGLTAATDDMDEATTWYRTHTKSLTAVIKSVTDSRDTKTLQTAKDALNSKINEARALLTSSDGNVADNATRESLTTAIDEASAIDGDDPTIYDESRAKLEAAMQTVNDSVTAKSEADAQAAAEAAAAAQAQQSYTPSYSYSGGTGTYGYTGTGSSGGSSSSSSSGSSSGSSFGGGSSTRVPGWQGTGTVSPDVAG